MLLQGTVLAAIGFGIAAIIFWSGKKASENSKWLLLTAAGATVSELLYYFEISCADIGFMQLVHNLSYLFKTFTLMGLWMFLCHYCGIRIRKKAAYAISAFLLLLSVTAALNSFHGLFYTPAGIGTDFPVPYLIWQPHVLHYVYVCGIWLVMFFCIIQIIRRISGSQGIWRKRYVLSAVVLLIPAAALPLSELLHWIYIDSMNLIFMICPLLLLVLTQKYGLSDAVMTAKESLTDNTKEGLLVVDTEYRVLYANDAVTEKYPAIKKLETEQEQDALKQMFLERESVYKKDGIHCKIRVSDICEGTILLGYMAWISDMSFHDEYTNEISVLKEKAEKADEEKTAFLANISHEIRTPLHTILDFSELILQQKESSALTREYAFDIRRSAKNLLQVVNEILNVSKMEAGKTEMVREVYHTQSLFEDVRMVIAEQAREKGLKYQATIDSQLPYRMKGAAASIREIMINIMNNAVKYTNEGCVSLDVRCKWRTEKQIQLEIVAADTGIGMEEKDVKAIFDSQPDTKGKRSAGGAGLGIAVVKGFVEQMNGDIKVESEYGKGTKITIYLTQEIMDGRPIGDANFSITDLEDKEFNQAFITTAKVLVVDDNERNLEVTAGLLEKYDIAADVADSGYTAIDAVRAKEYDIVFLDHMMPGMDGVETMLRIREMGKGKYGTLPIIALTADETSGAKEDMLMIGFDGYLAKPLVIKELERILLKFIPKTKISYVNAALFDKM